MTTAKEITQDDIDLGFEDHDEMDRSMKDVKSTDGEHVIQICKQISERHSAIKVDGIIIDAWTATAVWKVYNAVNDTNKEKMRNLRTVYKICNLAQKVMFR